MEITKIAPLAEAITKSIAAVIVGKEDMTRLLLAAVFSGGHVLLDDLPGTGKTTLAKAFARSVGISFKRVQFTPDLLPSDLTGINYYNQKHGEFVFREGPIFAGLVLADEINRATPRTQSSLLECMEESQVTIDGETRTLPNPFLVVATQNPVETAGTFPLPEAQLDRFFMRLRMGYPETADAVTILSRFQTENPLESVTPVAEALDIAEAREACAQVKVVDAVREYIVAVVEATRAHERVALGVSPRGSLALMRGAQAYAAIEGRDYVTPDDVKRVSPAILAHRLIIKGQTIASAARAEDAVADVLSRVNAPVETV